MLTRRLSSVCVGLVAFALVGVARGQTVCCEPWDNGPPDGRTAMTSQTGFGQDWRIFGLITADDFYLCDANITRIDRIRGRLNTDSIVPKADVIIFEDCDGQPNREIAHAYSVPPDYDPPSTRPCTDGVVTIFDNQQPGPDGFRTIEVEASFDGLWLRGGEYWVAIIGFSGTGEPDEQFFWPTANNQHVRGHAGELYDTSEGQPVWTSIDEVCCGCTDFSFCVEGHPCKILLDNGGPEVALSQYVPGDPSLENGGSQSRSRAADDFVAPPCRETRLCYIEAWVWTNCDTIRLDLFRQSVECSTVLPSVHRPTENPPFVTFQTSCVFDTGLTIGSGSTAVTLKKAVFTDFGDGGYLLDPNQNYWLSAYSVGDGSQSAMGFFCHNSFCDRICWINFDAACTKGPPYGSSQWVSSRQSPYPHDLAFLVAVEIPPQESPASVPPEAACAGDFNRDGHRSMQDLFDFMAAYFAGCP